MKKLIAIGEALIDFIPSEAGKGISEVGSFLPKAGGAPANVCAAFSRLGGNSSLITQLGADAFGDKIVSELKKAGIDTSLVFRTDEAMTSLAFVALKNDGNREFAFFRKPGADMLLSESKIKSDFFEDSFALHFCSVSLGNFPMKDAHKKAIEFARKSGALVSFDPNLRFSLWNSKEELKSAVEEFLPQADILKVSDEELEFLTGKTDIKDALPILMKGNMKLVLFTSGSKGADAFTKNASAHSDGIKVRAVDTTGAGDAFIGSLLHSLAEKGFSPSSLENISGGELKEILDFSNLYCSMSVQKKGAIESYPTKEEIVIAK